MATRLQDASRTAATYNQTADAVRYALLSVETMRAPLVPPGLAASYLALYAQCLSDLIFRLTTAQRFNELAAPGREAATVFASAAIIPEADVMQFAANAATVSILLAAHEKTACQGRLKADPLSAAES